MKAPILLAVGFLGLTGMISAAAQPSPSALQVLFPTNTHVATSTAEHYLIGKADTVRVARVEATNFVQKSTQMEVQPGTLAQDFPRLVKRLFGKNFVITSLTVVRSYADERASEREMKVEFPFEKRVDLQAFWGSKKFQKVYTKAVRDTAAEQISVTMQGYRVVAADFSKPEYREKFHDFFILRVSLKPGSNQILLRAYDSRNEVLQEAPFTFVFKSKIDKKTEVPTSFASPVFHVSENETPCSQCHRMRPAGAERTDRQAVSNLCFPCHKRITEAAYLHGPVSTWNCLFCHDGNGDFAGRFSPPDSSQVADLCYQCHKSLRAAHQSKPYTHGPVASGECSLCHSPHGSDHPAQLWMSVKDLCVTCHGDRYLNDHPVLGHPISGVPDPLNAERELSCISCHNPHNGETRQLYYTATGLYQLCQECHKK